MLAAPAQRRAGQLERCGARSSPTETIPRARARAARTPSWRAPGGWSRWCSRTAGSSATARRGDRRRSSSTRALAGDERLVARSALGLTLSALYGPTPVPEAIAQCEALIADDLRRPPGAGPDHVQARPAAGDERRVRRRRATLYVRRPARCCAISGRACAPRRRRCDLAMIELLAGDPARPSASSGPTTRCSRTMGETYFLSTMAALLARAVREQGRDDEALELTRHGRSAAPPTTTSMRRCCGAAIRAPILARAGAIEEAEALARAALERARKTECRSCTRSLIELATVMHLAERADEARAASTRRSRSTTRKATSCRPRERQR